MSGETEDDPDYGEHKTIVTKTTLHQLTTEIERHRAAELSNDQLSCFEAADTVEPDFTPFHERLEHRREAIEARLAHHGFPPPSALVFVEGDRWKLAPADVVEHTRKTFGRLIEVCHPRAPFQLERGDLYTRRRVERNSEPWWLVHLGRIIWELQRESDPDRRLQLAFRLGEDWQRYLATVNYSEGVARDELHKAHNAANVEARQKAAEPWKSLADELAEKYWSSKPHAPSSEISKRVHDEFQRRIKKIVENHDRRFASLNFGELDAENPLMKDLILADLLNANGEPPAEGTIRKHIGRLRPPRSTR